jgi:glycosyltransferase involved in cell wall biosynthesis
MHALACGLPVICIEGDATAETITLDCGIVVKLGDKEEIVRGLTEALLTLYKDRELLKKLSKNAQELVFREYSWEKKVDFVTKIYYNLLNNIEK